MSKLKPGLKKETVISIVDLIRRSYEQDRSRI